MSINKDPLLLRSIIMQHYDKPLMRKNELVNEEEYLSFQNKSSTCIDDITAIIRIEKGIITKAYFSGMGCAISTASSDIICELITNKTVDQALLIIDNYLKMTMGEKYDEEILDELIAFHNIHQQANRIKCSQIGINAFKAILEKLGK